MGSLSEVLETFKGEELKLTLDPAPNWPYSFVPQHQAAPASVTLHVWVRPASIIFTGLESPTTWTGTLRSSVVPSPNWPPSVVLVTDRFKPQHETLAPSVRAQAWCPPAVIVPAPGVPPPPLAWIVRVISALLIGLAPDFSQLR
jgi:hypothetical protein